jgi:K+-sensing histidine kinase KdpD
MSSGSNPIGNDKVPWKDVVRFVRQLSHDLRNHLNAIELHAALLAELGDAPELKSEVKQLREIVSEMGGALQKLTMSLSPASPQMMPYRAADFMQDLRNKIANVLPKESASIEWSSELKDEVLRIDPELLQQAVIEVVTNAFQHGPGTENLSSIARTDAGSFRLELREPKKSFDLPTENWGGAPLRGVGRGRYGLGLHRARVIVENQQGELKAQYDSQTSTLTTTIALPLFKDGA